MKVIYNSTLKTVLFFVLIATALTSCKKDEETEVPVITVSGPNPMYLDSLDQPFYEPGVSTSSGTIVTDLSAVNFKKRGEYTVYYSAVDGPNVVGYATRQLIMKNPSESLVGAYNVEVRDANGDIIDYYVDNISTDDYVNGKFYFSNFSGDCLDNFVVTAKYFWLEDSLDLYTGQDFQNNTLQKFAVNVNGSNISFEMEITNSSGNTNTYTYVSRDPNAPSATLMATHLAMDGPPVDIHVDNEKAVSALDTAVSTSYLTLDAGNQNFKIKVEGSCTTVPGLEGNVSLSSGQNYSAFAVGSGSVGYNLLLLNDDLSNPASGNARVRFLHAVPGAPNVTISTGGSAVFTDVEYKEDNTIEVPSGSYVFDVTEASSGTPLLSTGSVNFDPGKVYTVIAYPSGGGIGVKLITNK
jgi:hypothetical protein